MTTGYFSPGFLSYYMKLKKSEKKPFSLNLKKHKNWIAHLHLIFS